MTRTALMVTHRATDVNSLEFCSKITFITTKTANVFYGKLETSGYKIELNVLIVYQSNKILHAAVVGET